MMITYIPHTIGKVYDVAHLRPFDLELAKQGHPCVTFQGETIRLLRDMDGAWRFDVWRDGKWTARTTEDLEWTLRLAPLAIKNNPRTGKDEPLHVGDVIEFNHPFGDDKFHKITLKGNGDAFGLIKDMACAEELWRWPVEVQG